MPKKKTKKQSRKTRTTKILPQKAVKRNIKRDRALPNALPPGIRRKPDGTKYKEVRSNRSDRKGKRT